jgi:hypothetical protein
LGDIGVAQCRSDQIKAGAHGCQAAVHSRVAGTPLALMPR